MSHTNNNGIDSIEALNMLTLPGERQAKGGRRPPKKRRRVDVAQPSRVVKDASPATTTSATTASMSSVNNDDDLDSAADDEGEEEEDEDEDEDEDDEDDDDLDADVDEMTSIDELRLEVKRLRVRIRELTQKRKRKPRKKKEGPKLPRDIETGKRAMSTGRQALAAAIRAKMRWSMGIAEHDDLPDPDGEPTWVDGDDGVPRVLARPDWRKSPKHSKEWLKEVAKQVLDDAQIALARARASIHTGSPRQFNQEEDDLAVCPIPEEDLTYAKAWKAANTAFINFVKRWKASVNPETAEMKARQAQRRRRWARKDLKQKKRARAANDPTYASRSYPNILLFDYMSSEYSSEGERDPYKGSGLDPPLAEGVWEEIRRTMADQGIDAGQKAQRKTRRGKDIEVKVLEVRTPRWRSEVLNEVFNELDQIAASQSKAQLGDRWIAPSHLRFKLATLRDLPPPKEAKRVWEYDPTWLAMDSETNAEARGRIVDLTSTGLETMTAGRDEAERTSRNAANDQCVGLTDSTVGPSPA